MILTGFLIGVGLMLLISLTVTTFSDPAVLRELGGVLLAVLAAPVCALMVLIERRPGPRAGRISAEAVARFARQTEKDEAYTWGLFYGRRGWISVRGLRRKGGEPDA